MIICLSGKAGSGKSTLAKKIAENFNLKYRSGGDALKEIAVSRGYNYLDEGWWETEEGQSFLAERQETADFDKQVDQKLIELAEKGDVILDSWTMPWLMGDRKCFKIWLKTSNEVRIQRVSKRDSITLDVATQMVKEKDRKSKEIYKTLYNIDFGDDLAPFDLVINTDYFNSNEIYEIISGVLNILIKHDPY